VLGVVHTAIVPPGPHTVGAPPPRCRDEVNGKAHGKADDEAGVEVDGAAGRDGLVSGASQPLQPGNLPV
jgi:hypothetical protein